ncbi:metallopeptidase family protein [Peptoniphilus senegalensis]|uniref:Metallopeptidase family protein n=1 Tax=Peptoniphilus senegalensis TaxID=1465757 RepID=A0ABV1J385_9FIRM
MLDEDGKKIYISDNENNIEIPIKLIEDFYYKKENDIELSSSDNDKLPKVNEEENLIDETNDENKDDKQEESKEEAGEEQKLDREDKYDSYYLDRIDEVQEILEEICESIPSYAYEHLNGGIILTEESKFHDESYAEDLVIMGEYQRSILGNMIKIYYGSFMELYRYSSREILKEKLEEVLLHEFTHHLEFLANEWGLVIEDNKFLEEYRKRKQNE